MRKNFLIAASLATVAACGAPAPPAPPPAPSGAGVSGETAGAMSPNIAVGRFLNAARAQDVQAMAAVWGTSRGPARETIERTELEKRVIIMQCYLDNESWRILSQAPGEGGRYVTRVELKRGNNTRTPNIYTIRGPSARWYVESVEIAAVRDFCGMPMPTE